MSQARPTKSSPPPPTSGAPLPLEFRLARELVTRLDTGRENDLDGLALALGVGDAGDASFTAAVRIAESAGMVKKDPSADPIRIRPVTEEKILGGNLSVLKTGYLDDVVGRIGNAVAEGGVLDVKDLARIAGESASSATFRAAIRRALTRGDVEWLTPTSYGIPREQLGTFEREDQAAVPAGPDWAEAVERLAIAIKTLGDALAVPQPSPGVGSSTPPAPPAGDDSGDQEVGRASLTSMQKEKG